MRRSGRHHPHESLFLEGGCPGIVARERDFERQLLLDSRVPELLSCWKVALMRYDEMPTL